MEWRRLQEAADEHSKRRVLRSTLYGLQAWADLRPERLAAMSRALAALRLGARVARLHHRVFVSRSSGAAAAALAAWRGLLPVVRSRAQAGQQHAQRHRLRRVMRAWAAAARRRRVLSASSVAFAGAARGRALRGSLGVWRHAAVATVAARAFR